MRFGLLTLLIACGEEEKEGFEENPNLTIDITSHSEGSEVVEGEVEFRATALEDGEASGLSVYWYLDRELVCDGQEVSTVGYSFCTIPITEESGAVAAVVQNAEGQSAGTEISLTVIPIDAPVIEEFYFTNSYANYYTDHPVLISAKVSDSEDQPEELTASWTSSIDGELDLQTTPSANGKLTGSILLSEGSHVLTLTVTDTAGKTRSASTPILVGPENVYPTLSLDSSLDGTTVVVGSNVDFTAVADDVDIPNQLLEINWTSSLDGVLDSSSPDEEGNIGFSTEGLSAGTHTISVQAEDEVGASSSEQISLVVSHLPTASISSPIADSVFPSGTTLELIGLAADQDDASEELTVTWTSSVDGELFAGNADSSGQAVVSTDTLSSGFHDLTFTVTDTSGLEASDSITIQINANPEVDSITLSPDPIYSNQDLTASASFSDADGDTVTGSYEWYEDGVLTFQTGATVSASELDVDEVWTVRVTPNDGYGNGAYLEQSITISNTAPTISEAGISSSDSDFYNTSVLTCAATADDIDETVTVSYNWVVDGTSYSGADLDLSTITISPEGVVECTASVTDSQGESASSSDSVTLVNRAPSVDTVTIDPNTGVVTNTMLICSSTISDADGETLTGSYGWFLDGVSVGTSETLTLDNEGFSPSDVVECVVSVEDGFGGTASSSSSVTVENTDPLIDTSSLTPAEPSTTDLVLCSATASDSDGDTPTLSFAFSNQTTSAVYTATAVNADSAELDLSQTDIEKDDVLLCEITATDADGGSASATLDVTIFNSTPVFTSDAEISSSLGAYTGIELSCSATGEDAEDGSLTPEYSWTVDGVEVETGEAYTIDAADTDVGDTIVCTATLTDNEGAVSSSEASVIVENTDPTVTIPVITPDAAVLNDSSLSCSATADDADETVSVSYVWEQNGTEFATGDTVDLGAYSILPEDEISCVASVSDSNGGLASEESSVMVDNRAPTVTTPVLSNASPEANETITCSATTDDADGETLTISYGWTIDGIPAGNTDTLVLSSQAAVVGAEIICAVAVQDAAGDSAFDSISGTVQNTDPTITTAVISPSTVYTGTELTCAADGDDLNDGYIGATYSWSVNGLELGTGETYTVDASETNVGDSILCTATVEDNDGSSVSSQASISITNSDPTIADLAVNSPSGENYVHETLTCSATVDDADETPNVSYTWTSNGSQLGTNQTLDLSGTSLGANDPVTCTIDATDSNGGSAQDSVTVNVGDQPPSAPTVSIDWDSSWFEPILTDTLICLGSGSIDPEGATVTYSYAWTSDVGGSVAGDTLSSAETADGEIWTCTVTVSDGAIEQTETASKTIYPTPSWDNCPADQTVEQAPYQITGASNGDVAGRFIAPAGDVNGDGLDDILIAKHSPAQFYLILGSSLDRNNPTSNLSTADFILDAENTGDLAQANYSTSFMYSAGDVDGDGKGDVLIGTPSNDEIGTNSGKVYLFLGASFDVNNPPTSLADADFSFTGEAADNHAGWAVDSADVDNDGLSDLLISAYRNKDGGAAAGKIYIILGSSLDSNNPHVSLSTADFTLTGEGIDSAGGSLSTAGDVDNDGLDDILIGATFAQEAYLVLGSSLDSNNPHQSLSTVGFFIAPENGADYAGYSLSGGGDVDGDGLDDLLIGAYENDDGGSQAGKSYLILGSSLDPNNSTISLADADFSFVGATGDNSGIDVSFAGDLDGDGLSDVLIGARYADDNGLNMGSAYVILGSSLDANNPDTTLVASYDYIFMGEGSSSYFGEEVAPIGDIDGDGVSDLLLGSERNNDAASNAGKVYIFRACQ